MAKTIINGYCEIKNGEFIKFCADMSAWLGTHKTPTGDIVKCKVTVEYEYPKDSL